MPREAALLRLMPGLFVLIWSTGFVVARYAMPHAPPMSFLCIRFALSLACFGIWIVLARAHWPADRAQWWHLAVSGVLMHAGYLGGVWAAVKHGIGAGTVALLVGLQPVLTALWMSATASRTPQARAPVLVRQWIGLLLGLAGLALVVGPKLGAGEVTAFNLLLGVLALVSITVGTLYQKRHVEPTDVRTANAIQLLAALVVSLPFAWLEAEAVQWHVHVVGAHRLVGACADARRQLAAVSADPARRRNPRDEPALPGAARRRRSGLVAVRRDGLGADARGHAAHRRRGCAGAA